MTLHVSTSRGDDGFSLIEVLVALAIASMAIVALGSLYRVTAEAHQRSIEANEVQEALFNVESEVQDLGSETGRSAILDAASIVLQSAPSVQAPVLRLGIESTSPGSKALVLTRGTAKTAVDLSAFDNAIFEYWLPTGHSMSWSAVAASTATPRAVRLRLQLGTRVWRPLIWVTDKLADENI